MLMKKYLLWVLLVIGITIWATKRVNAWTFSTCYISSTGTSVVEYGSYFMTISSWQTVSITANQWWWSNIWYAWTNLKTKETSTNQSINRTITSNEVWRVVVTKLGWDTCTIRRYLVLKQ